MSVYKLHNNAHKTAPPDPDNSNPLDIQPGDLYQLGPHRLLCSDSTDLEAVARLMAGRLADYSLTDPPYGETACKWDRKVIWWPSVAAATKRTGQLTFFSSMRLALSIGSELEGSGWVFRWDFAWNKPGGMMVSRKLPIRAHENVLTWARKGVKPSELYFDGYAGGEDGKPYIRRRYPHRSPKGKPGGSLRNFKTTDTINSTGRRYLTSSYYASGKNSHTGVKHPTAKPPRLVEKFILAMCPAGGLVFDPFLGSGTTLVAAQQVGRACYGIEMSQGYCQLIIERWEAMTGHQAVLLERLYQPPTTEREAA